MTTSNLIDLAKALDSALADDGIPARFGRRPAMPWGALERVLAPLVPAGTQQWAIAPAPRQSRASYVADAISIASQRAAWAGGLQA